MGEIIQSLFESSSLLLSVNESAKVDNDDLVATDFPAVVNGSRVLPAEVLVRLIMIHSLSESESESESSLSTRSENGMEPFILSRAAPESDSRFLSLVSFLVRSLIDENDMLSESYVTIRLS